MWLFKRKVKRSEWMEGLLWAESLKQQGYQTEDIYNSLSGAEKCVIHNDLGKNFNVWKYNSDDLFIRGAVDYLKYFKINL